MAKLPFRPAKSYDDTEGPRFAGQFGPEHPPKREQLTVVTYNIDHGLEVTEAIAAFQSFTPLLMADIVLLQELDEAGIARIAETLRMNYVYYPASVSVYGRNFGNAILSPWSIRGDRKLILPRRQPLTKQLRIAVHAEVAVGDVTAQVYCTHTEIYSTTAAHRREQVEALREEIAPGDARVIVGGDFNTVSNRSIKRLARLLGEVGLRRTSAGAGPTVAKYGLRPSAADHIFTRGFRKLAGGTVDLARASDHFPVWVQVAPETNDRMDAAPPGA